jgi:hypothetical protein
VHSKKSLVVFASCVLKVDLLPKGTDMAAVGDWLLRATLAKKLKYVLHEQMCTANNSFFIILFVLAHISTRVDQ